MPPPNRLLPAPSFLLHCRPSTMSYHASCRFHYGPLKLAANKIQYASHAIFFRSYSPVFQPLTPLQIYENAAERKLIKTDPHQIDVLKNLHDLYFKISAFLQNQLNQSKTISFLQKFKIIQKEETPKGLYIYGGVGTGKTTIMDMFYNSLQTNLKKRVHFHSFMLDIHARLQELKKLGLKTGDKQPIVIVADEIASVTKVLCFDEFQVTDIADAMILRQLMTELFDKGVVVVCTSNRHPDDLYKNGLSRESFLSTIELIKEKCIVQSLDSGIDYRKNHTSSTNVYISSQDPKSNSILDKTFGYLASLTGLPAEENKKIYFLGRFFSVRKSNHDIAYMTYQDMCENALSAADYIEIAKAYKVIIISNVPQLGANERDQARRFITLIDSLYENQVVLVMSCEYDVFNLFNIMSFDSKKLDSKQSNNKTSLVTGEEERFAFDRTLSRLVEMKSTDYLKLASPKEYLDFFLRFNKDTFN